MCSCLSDKGYIGNAQKAVTKNKQPNSKMGEDILDRHFSKEDTQMARKHMIKMFSIINH